MNVRLSRCVTFAFASLALFFSSAPPLQGQVTALAVLSQATTLIDEASRFLSGVAKSSQDAYCSVLTIKDTQQARDENAGLTLLSMDLVSLEVTKQGMLDAMTTFQRTKTQNDWRVVRKATLRSLDALGDVTRKLSRFPDFIGHAPDDARRLLIGLNRKESMLQDLAAIADPPISPDETREIARLRIALQRELAAIELAHNGIVRYMEARFVAKKGCNS